MSRVKYPRTMNFAWSESNSSDDVWWKDSTRLAGKQVVVTEKMDGECTSIYPDGHIHARSIDTQHHPSRSWVKQLAGQIAHEIPQGWRICGENVYAYHSIFYTELPSYFLVYGVYDGDRCLSWADTEEICSLLGLHTVPVIYKGLWDEKTVRELWTGTGAYPTYEGKDGFGLLRPKFPDDFSPCVAEGYVVRIADHFQYADFAKSVAKYVRANHVKTDSHWMERAPIPNLLKAT